MKNILIGYTGFVGSNLKMQHNFDEVYNSSNIEKAFGTMPDLCIYSGVRSEMFLANSNPEADFEIINEAIDNIKKINPKKIILISTVAVYDKINNVNEDSYIDKANCTAYGKNRLFLEEWIQSNCKDYLILRLPAIYGENLKKNFIFDIINITPMLLKESKFKELCEKDDFIKNYYVKQENGFFKCTDKEAVKSYFQNIGFSAINFTDSRSIYQFYNLANLWDDINKAISKNIKLLNLVTEPISASELYKYVFGKEFENEIIEKPFDYDIKSNYFDGGYMYDKNYMLRDIKKFIEERI